MKIKIACVISQLNFGGAQTMLIRLIKGIDTSKFEIKLFVCGEKLDNSLEQEIDRENIEVEYLDLKEKNGVLTTKASIPFFVSIPNQPNSQTAIRTEPQTGVMIELLTVIMTNP